MGKSRKYYPKRNQNDTKNTIQELKSQINRLKKENDKLRSENRTLQSAWNKTEEYLEEITGPISLEELLKTKKITKQQTNKPKTIEEARKKWAEWRKNLRKSKDE